MNTKPLCLDCKKEIYYDSVRCRSCESKRRHKEGIIKIQLIGEENPAYKHGLPKCIDCDKTLTQYSAIRCKSCETKYRHEVGVLDNSGENHPHFNNWSSRLPYSKEFNKETKDRIRELDGYICKLCGLTDDEHILLYGYSLIIHHINYNKLDSSEDNLLTVCNQCNSKANFNRDKWEILCKKLVLERKGSK